jgi:4-amino-4-deoxy-L-arabinose transferase-like glycosyltransferase
LFERQLHGELHSEDILLSRPAIWLALLTAALHLLANGEYDYHRDELYFIVCGQRPDWGYVDQPPLIPLLASLMHALFPNSLTMFRLIPALAHAGTVALTAETARKLDGDIWAQLLAGMAALLCPLLLAFGTIFYTDSLQPMAWSFCSYVLICIIRDDNERWWLPVGLVIGLAFMVKYTIALWVVALVIGILLTSARGRLARPGPYVAALAATLIVLPNLLWQWVHGWPFLEFAAAVVEGKNVESAPWTFVLVQMRDLGPVTAPIWLAGLAAFAFWGRFADLRAVAIAYLLLLVAMIALHAKSYYPSGAYPVLFAGGAVALEAWLMSRHLRTALLVGVVLFGLPPLPFVVPLLSIDRFAAYQGILGVAPEGTDQRLALGRLPQFYAEMFGWRELAALVGDAYQSLSPEERADAVFFADNYGEAAAVDVFAKARGLPPSISTHNNYYLWGPRGHTGDVVIHLGGRREDLLKVYASVEAMGKTDNPWALPLETGQTIWICRGRFKKLDDDWSKLKHYHCEPC